LEETLDSISNAESNLSYTEDVVRLIWQEALHSPITDTKQSFLDCGGDSLSAMLCISRLRARFGVELTIEDFLMDDSTIENLTISVLNN